MTFGSLFAGIGGFDLGFERAGMTCKWQVEIDPYCQAAAFGARHIRRRMFIVASSAPMDDSDGIHSWGVSGPPETYRRWTENTPIRSCFDGGAWSREPELDRVAYGIPDRMDRRSALGNAVVPQVAEWIGRRIMAYEHSPA